MSLRLPATATLAGVPSVSISMTTSSAWPTLNAHRIGRARQPMAMSTGSRRPIRRTVSTNAAVITTCQIAAATGNGSRARGRNRMASSGGLTYGPMPSVVDGM